MDARIRCGMFPLIEESSFFLFLASIEVDFEGDGSNRILTRHGHSVPRFNHCYQPEGPVHPNQNPPPQGSNGKTIPPPIATAVALRLFRSKSQLICRRTLPDAGVQREIQLLVAGYNEYRNGFMTSNRIERSAHLQALPQNANLLRGRHFPISTGETSRFVHRC